ncbi:MAG: amino acid adenylation domain-containing protein, partial [Elusimicrobia bacterium]|nr:amino acid adenylation domain-containing protein [Elusimicrobiota bacterium]
MNAARLSDQGLLDHLESLGCVLRPAGHRLRCVLPGGAALTEELRAQVRDRKPALLALLRPRRIRLSDEQERLWFLDRYGGPGGSAYHMPSAYRIAGELSAPLLARAWGNLLLRHESLRTVFRSARGSPYQVVREPSACSLRAEPAAQGRLESLLAAEARRPFDLEQGPLSRLRLLRLGPEEHVLCLCQHHIVSDGRSTEIILDELSRDYAALAAGREGRIPEPPLQYADYALWQRSRAWEARLLPQEQYWLGKLRGLEALELPLDRGRLALKTLRGGRHGFRIGPRAAAGVRKLAAEEDATAFMVLLTAFQVLLRRLCSSDDVAVGTPLAGRGLAGLESTVGFFVNTVVLRTALVGELQFRQALREVRRTCLEAYAHPDYPFGRLVDRLRAGRDPSRSPLCDVFFVLRQAGEGGALRLPGCQVSEIRIPYPTAKFDLTLEMADEGRSFAGEFEYHSDLFSPETASRLAGFLQRVLEAGCRRPQTRLRDIEILERQEREAVLRGGNRTAAPLPARSLPDLFREQAGKTPRSAALVSERGTLSYAELDRASDAAAARLLQALGGPGAIVGLPAAPGPETLACLLGILKAGCAYLPLDLDYPAERLAFMLKDSGAAAVLAHPGVGAGGLGPVPVVLVEGDAAPQDAAALRRARPGPRSLAYLMYTSGSTGEPKGVLVEHRGVANLAAGQREAFGIDRSSRVLQFAPLSFDASVSEIFTALLSGAQLHLIDDEAKKDPDLLLDRLERRGVTVATLPPALLGALPRRRLPRLRTLVVAGDLCDEGALRRWGKGRTLINAYGPTEATVCSSMKVWREGVRPANIGRPMRNVRAYVLDQDLRLSPLGVPGELCLAGAGLARGYHKRPDLERSCFLSGPGGAGRLYRTGDRARWLAGGELEFLGHRDGQLKVRGFRVEPGEVEAALRAHPAVASCAAVLAGGRLAAYWVPSEGRGETLSAELKEFLAARLPAHAVPSVLPRLDALPLTPSGKLDRQALASREPAEPAAEGRAPGTALERRLAGIWRQVLRLDSVGADQDFFALGGDSIMSIQVVSRAREAGLALDPKDLFTHPTIAALAAQAGRAQAPAVRKRACGEASLTPIQRWFFELGLPKPHHFNQAVLLCLEHALDARLAGEAARRLAQRHDSLRLRFHRDEAGRWRQSYGPSPGPVSVVERDLSGRAGDLDAECGKLQGSLDIREGPLLALGLFRGLPDPRQRLFIAIHHLAVDAVSWRILLDDFARVYEALASGRRPPVPGRRSCSFQQWGEALQRYRDGPAQAQWDLWLGMQAGPAAAAWDAGGGPSRTEVELGEVQTAQLLAEAPVAYHASAQDLLLSALLAAWQRVTGSRELFVHLEGHGRESIDPAADAAAAVGWFTSLYPVLLRAPAAQDSDAALIKAVKETLRSVPDHGLGYGVLRYLSEDPRARLLAERPQPEIAFNYLGRLEPELRGPLAGRLDPQAAGPASALENPAPHALEIDAWVAGGRLRAAFAARHRETAERLAAAFRESLSRLISHCLQPGSGGHTPCDFPLARLSQAAVESLTAGEPTESIYPLSPMQEGLLFHALYAPDSDQYIEQLCWTLEGPWDPAALKEAWAQILRRHAVLRTAFFSAGLERPLQVVRRDPRLDWRELDWRGVPEARRDERVADYLRRDRQEGFDLRQAGLCRFHLIRTGAQRYRFIWCFHHVLMDGWCLSLLLDEFRRRYAALVKGRALTLPSPRPFADYVAWLEGRDRAADEAFWRSQLSGVGEPTPLGINTRPLGTLRPISDCAEESLRFSAALTRRISGFARERRLTVNSVLQTAWALVLGAYSGRREVVLGVNVSGRPAELAGVDRMVGLFVNAVPVRFVLDPGARAGEAVARMHELMREVGAHSYGSLADLQRFSGVPPNTPLFLSEYVFENYPAGEPARAGPGGLRLRDFRAVEKTNYPLGLMAAPGPRLSLKAAFDAGSFAPQSIRRLLGHLRTAAEWLVRNPGSRLGRARIMPDAERELVLRRWSGAQRRLPPEGPLPFELFARQARADPGRTALVCGGRSLSYGDLDRLSGGIAAALAEAGCRPGRLAGFLLDRGPAAAAAVLGIMRSGAGCVPLDPAWPDARLRALIADAGPTAITTQAGCLPRLRALWPGGRLLCCDEPGDRAAAPSRCPARPGDAAYVIFTSGSTGAPKGVRITGRNLSDHVAAAVRHYGITAEDAVLQFSALSFDAAYEQLFAAWAAGARLVMRGEALWTPAELKDALLSQGVTVMNLPTGYFREVAKAWSADPEGLRACRLRLLIVGGDVLDPDSVALWQGLPLPAHRFLNAYGPTETTITAATCELRGRPAVVPIGRPLGARRLYVLGGGGQVLPPGVPGELCIGGIGVSPGYLGRPEAGAQRFADDPFAPPAERRRGCGRLYRTGDLARWNEAGELEFLGRSDFQAKVRGFRVEPEEIELALARHPAVSACAVVLSGEEDDRSLAAYFVPAQSGGGPEAAQGAVAAWAEVYDELFSRAPQGRDGEAFDTTGWNSSFDGSPIPEEQMREWVAGAAARILELRPGSVLEVGCGTGLILREVAPHCRRYLGLDFSAPAVARLRRRLAQSPIPGAEVVLERADSLGGLAEPGSVDTVVLNSVIQYFPELGYLERVLELALAAAPKGNIFIGDVRDLRLQDAFRLEVALARGGAALPEKELLVSPHYFLDFAARHPRVSDVRLMPKLGAFPNEMNRYRFDAVLRVGGAGAGGPRTAPAEVPWRPGLDLDGLLASCGGAVLVRGYPDRRVWAAQGLTRRLAQGGELGGEKERLEAQAQGFLPLSELAALAARRGYRFFPRLSLGADPARWDLYYLKKGLPPAARSPIAGRPAELSNRPLERFLRRSIPAEELRRFLSSRLPDYMVPSLFVELDALPATPSGKPDRRALARLGRRPLPRAGGGTAPRDELERMLADTFAEVLRLDRVGVRDDFFALGGHSLSATRAASRVGQAFGVDCPVKAVFEHPRVAELAAFVRERLADRSPARPPLVRTGGPGPFPLSFAQERLWFLERLEAGGGGCYHMPAAFRLKGPLDVMALRRSLDLLVSRHESLRTVFPERDGEPRQEVLAASPAALELRAASAGEAAGVLESLLRTPFDLQKGPLFKACLLKTGPDEHVLLLDQHHITGDAWSAAILFEELSRCYAAFSRGRDAELAPLPARYADFAVWQRGWLRGETLQALLDHWRERLAGAPRLELPAARPRRERAWRRGRQLEFSLGGEVAAELKRAARETGGTLYMAVLALFSILLGGCAGEEDVLVGTVLAGRDEPSLEGVVGFFVNTVLLRVDLGRDPSFRRLLERVKRTALEAYARQDLPFEKLVAELRPERGMGSSPLLSALLVFQNAPEACLRLDGLQVSPLGLPPGGVRSDLDLYAWEDDGALRLAFVYDEELFDEATIAALAGRLQDIAATASRGGDAPLSALSFRGGRQAPQPPLPLAAQAGRLRLSFHQERLCFIDRFEEKNVYEGKPVYHNLPLLIELDGPVDAAALERRLRQVVGRHEALRTAIRTSGEEAWQEAADGFQPRLQVLALPGAGPALLRQKALEFAGRPFGPEEEPRLRAALLRGDGDKSLFVAAVHHILADRRSLDLVARELASGAGAPEDLPYGAFSSWQRSVPASAWQPLLCDWKWRLKGELPVLRLPESRPRPAIHTYTAGTCEFELPADLTGRAEGFARREGIGLFDLLLSGFMASLLCCSGQEELIVGILGEGRPEGARDAVGPFANLLPIRARLDSGRSFRAFLGSVAAATAEARAGAALPFDLLVAELKPPVDMSRTALFDVLFDLRLEAEPWPGFGTAAARVWETNQGLGKYDLNLLMLRSAGRLRGTLVFNSDIYDPGAVSDMMERFQAVLANLLARPDVPAREVSWLSPAEQERQAALWDGPAAAFPERETLHGLFRRQAARTPDRTAVVCGGERLSYRGLDERSDRLAGRLRRLGVGPDTLVALLLERSPDAVAAMLAVLKAGGAYLPIDAALPEERIDFMLADSGAAALVSTTELRRKVRRALPAEVLLDADRGEAAALPAGSPEDLAYCIYTSGSTGRPKGVLMEHRSVVRLLKNERLPFDFGADDVWTLFHSYAFDFSVWEMYGALLFGGRLVVVPAETARDPALLLDLILKEGVTVLNQVPSSFYGLARAALERGAGLPLRWVVFGGEALDYGRLGAWHERYPAMRLANMYGITETCVHVTCKEIGGPDIAAGVGNIGRPLPETAVYLLDRWQRPVPAGLPGEICVGGGGLARGYLKRPELDAARFVPDPFRPGRRLYRSGDLGRWLPSGELEYLGRSDDQVQIRGFRVEPGEIASRLAEHPGVGRAAVRVWDRGGAGDQVIAAYFAPSRSPGPGPEELKAFLAERLPGYMVPAHVVRLDDWPLSPGGKVDRRRLPEPRAAPPEAAAGRAPRDPMELRLRGIWEELVGVAPASIDEDFFLCGGHSLLAVKLLARIDRLFGTSHPVSWAFLNRSIAEQARALRQEGRSVPFQPLVAFHRGGGGPPLVLAHPGQAGAEAYGRLAGLLAGSLPFYAVESRNLYDESRPMLASVPDLCAACLDEVLAVCGKGPCSLGGWSFGGLVAFELALRLSGLGVEVRDLFLIDAVAYDGEGRRTLKELAARGDAEGLLARGALWGELSDQQRDRLARVARAEFAAMAGYQARPYGGRATLIKPAEERAAPEGGVAPPPDNGWSPLVRELEV